MHTPPPLYLPTHLLQRFLYEDCGLGAAEAFACEEPVQQKARQEGRKEGRLEEGVAIRVKGAESGS